MRPIKFRAYCRSMQKMIPVDLLDMRFPEEDGSPRIVANKSLLADGDAELMQFTGLQDQNGTDIYEGDILEDDCGLWKIGFDEGAFLVASQDGTTPIGYSLVDMAEWTDVVGNIYEDPELIEEEK